MKTLLLLACTSATLFVVGCKSDKSGSSDKKEAAGLEMSSSSAVCKKAMTCCEASVKAEKGSVTPEDLNLKCSGVALAKTDDECEQFRQGYAAVFSAKGTEAPAECK